MIKNFKNLIFYTYSFFSTAIENIFLRKNFKIDLDDTFHKYGFKKIILNKNFTLPINSKKIYAANPYLDKTILCENEIYQVIKTVFIENDLADILYKLTGFKYNIDHITAYETKHIPIKDRNKGWYANHWHKDGPYSKNNIKIVIPLNDILEESGGMRLMGLKFSSDFSPATGSDQNFVPDFIFNSHALESLLIFAPHLCLHKAGNPSKGIIRRQLIFQLNPSLEWSFGKYLYKNQKYIEPKFPLIYNTLKGKNMRSKLILK